MAEDSWRELSRHSLDFQRLRRAERKWKGRAGGKEIRKEKLKMKSRNARRPFDANSDSETNDEQRGFKPGGGELDFYGTTRVEERRGADGRGEACKVKE